MIVSVSIRLQITKHSDSRLRERMQIHYSQPKGFVGRSICYAILYNDVYYGHIVAGSASRFLPGRNEHLGISRVDLNHVVNNIFFNVSKVDGRYPIRNFTICIVRAFVQQVQHDWFVKYGDSVWGFETLIELPRTGEVYRRSGWTLVGQTKGQTCKRVAGQGTDSWTGKRVWDTQNLRPKRVFCLRVTTGRDTSTREITPGTAPSHRATPRRHHLDLSPA
jgi:hypothetical protein